jgi:hypothetical protein
MGPAGGQLVGELTTSAESCAERLSIGRDEKVDKGR